MSLKTALLDILFPVHCAQCGAEGAALCDPCFQKIRCIPPSCLVCKKLVPARGVIPAGRTCKPCREKTRIYGFISPFSYDTAAINPVRSQTPQASADAQAHRTSNGIKTLIHDLKYRRVRGNAEILGSMLYRAIAYHGIVLSRDALIIPIPLHPSRERTRGFNQAFLIARELGVKLGIPVRNDILRKIKKTKPQMELAREERLNNMAGAFAASDNDAVRNRTIVLLDDVKTTGATLEEAARALRSAGAKRVWAITVAH